MENLEQLKTRSTQRIKSGIKAESLIKMLIWIRGRLITVGTIAVFFIGWELLARAGLLSKLLFPYPTVIFGKLYVGITEGDYLEHLLITVTRLTSGFIFGGGTGLLLGMVMGWSRRIREIFNPLIAAIHPIPKFAILPVIIIAFGIGESSRIIIISIGAFFPMLINTMGGVLQINPTYYDVLENYGANQLDIFRRVVFPGSLPYLLTGARLSLKSSLTLSVGIEMVFGTSGLGTMLFRGWTSMNMPFVYSVLLIVSVIGIGSNAILERLKRVLVPWHQEISD